MCGQSMKTTQACCGLELMVEDSIDLIPNENEGSHHTFIHYKNNPDNPNSLSNNNVWSIYEDQSGALWIGTWGGGLNKLVPNENDVSSPIF
ncbi:hypothetical protein GWO43_07920, partial [candidate division KSB1 bacterium]|nr:hypothetical protein [candidate division KSB1 bacterium]NIS23896.1 hypothetical protein [candidate division KSB1 bacterium]NIT70813.1 hypothetical protein [candidate division KSB1 bacterium]NIU24545.1 hypothetical protein [candidate division KSB1 bacterium]NIU94499.1 hypothetical protein [candidate division KSB1 bacterium]